MAKPKEGPSALTTFVEKVGQLSRPQRIMICVGAFILVGVAFTFVSFKPNWDKKSDLQTKLDNKLNEVSIAKAKAEQLPMVREQRKQAEQRLALSAESLPKEKEIPELLDRISMAGTESGLVWAKFEPLEEVEYPERSYVEMPFHVGVAGDYHGIASFFDKVAHLPRIVNARAIVILPESEEQGSWKTLGVGGELVTYRFLEPEATDAKQKKNQKKK